MMQREIAVEIVKKSERSIFTPTKNKTRATPYFKYANISTTPAKAKYKALNPRIAKIFDVIIINSSLVIAMIAGIESTANKISVDSIKSRVKNRVVIKRFLSCFTKNFPP